MCCLMSQLLCTSVSAGFLFPIDWEKMLWLFLHQVHLVLFAFCCFDKTCMKASLGGKHLFLLGRYNLPSPREPRSGIHVEITEENSLLDCSHWLVHLSLFFFNLIFFTTLFLIYGWVALPTVPQPSHINCQLRKYPAEQ